MIHHTLIVPDGFEAGTCGRCPRRTGSVAAKPTITTAPVTEWRDISPMAVAPSESQLGPIIDVPSAVEPIQDG